MSVNVKWGNDEHTIIHYTYDGPLTLEDHAAADIKTVGMLNSVDHPVLFISDLLKLQVPPNLIGQFSQVNNLAMFTSPKSEMIVVVSVSGLLDIMVQIFGSVYKSRMSKVKLVNSVADAYTACENHLAKMRDAS